MHIDQFKKLSKQIVELEKTGVKFDVTILGDEGWKKGSTAAYFEPANFEVETLKQLSEVQTILARPMQLGAANCKIKFGKTESTVKKAQELFSEIVKSPAKKATLPTLKFFSPIAKNNFYMRMDVEMICDDPPEQEEDGVTYRYIGTPTNCQFCIPHTHALYNYLDKGHFFLITTLRNGKEKIFISNEMTVDTYLCFSMVSMFPEVMAKHLQAECFINANLAKVIRVKMEKDLATQYGSNAQNYNRMKDLVFKEYEKTVNAGLIDKLIKGTLPSGSYNQIKLTKDSALYEDIKIEAPGLLEQLYRTTPFDDRTDIYTLIRGHIQSCIEDVESYDWAAPTPLMTVEAGKELTAEAVRKNEEILKKNNEEQVVEKTFTINGINITVKRTNKNSRRYVNDIPINKEEVEPVCFRASCFDNQEIFDKFVTSVKQMSLKWHDAIANGVGMKIHDSLTYDEYRKAEAPPSAPKLRFRVFDGDVHLLIDGDKDRSVKCHFNELLKKLATLNRKTTDMSSSSTGYSRRNAAWARTQLTNLLIESCTFEEKTPVMVTEVDDKGNKKERQAKDADGKKMFNTRMVPLLTREDAQFIEKMAREYHMKALEKSKIFLATAVKNTGAVLERFNGEDHWVVQGKSRKYAVNARTNQVYNYDTKSYVCIVEPGHQISIGGDATAARLYALKNDGMTAAKISTIR